MLVSSCFDTLSHARDMIDEKERGHITVTRAKYPIFDGILDQKTRAIMMVILGCDVCAQGIPGVEDVVHTYVRGLVLSLPILHKRPRLIIQRKSVRVLLKMTIQTELEETQEFERT